MLVASLLGSGAGCWGFRHGGLGLFQAAVLTAVIVSAVQPPPPRVVVVPPPQEGYVWQAGYWTQQDGQWVWVDGGWVEARPAARYVPTHWEQTPDGQWQLVQAQWVGE